MQTQNKLAKIRDEIEALDAEIDETEGAPIPRVEAEARIAAVVDAPPNDQLLNSRPGGLTDGSFGFAGFKQMLERPHVLAAVFPTELKAHLIGLYDATMSDQTPGLPAAERRQKLAELTSQKFKLEEDEEAIVEEFESQGADVQHRPGADPVAALGLPVRGRAA